MTDLIGRDEAQDRAREELSKPQYAQESLTDTIFRRIDEFFDRLAQSTGVGTGWWALIITVLLVIAIAVLVRWYNGKVARGRTTADDGLYGPTDLTAAEHREAAERHAQAGDWADAIRERFRAIARELEERALVEPIPGRTADELAAAFSGADLRPATRLFDDVTYGGRPGTAEQYAAISADDDRVRAVKVVA